VDSVGDSLRRSLQSGSNISNEPFVKEHIVVQVKRVTEQKPIRFPDSVSTTGQNDWFAKTESHLVISSDVFTGKPFLRLYTGCDFKLKRYLNLWHIMSRKYEYVCKYRLLFNKRVIFMLKQTCNIHVKLI